MKYRMIYAHKHRTEVIMRLSDAFPGFAAEETTQEVSDYYNSTFAIVSKMAYLIGVPKEHFSDAKKALQIEYYNKLEQNKAARIIRNLSILRTAIELNFSRISREMFSNLKNITTLPEYVPQNVLNQLALDGISLYRANYQLIKYIIDINRHINDRINNCKDIFPVWLQWSYVRELFIMPNGLTEQGCVQAGKYYYQIKSWCPYGVYLNWTGGAHGNILFNDKKFVSLLYEVNEDCFSDLGKVSDASDLTKHGIYGFLADSDGSVMLVDCENSDPYKLYAVLENLNHEVLLDKIQKIILFDDVHAASAWSILNQFTDIPIEHVMIERLTDRKSLVDIKLTATACREHYQNGVNSLVLVSSDSDYWGLITSMPSAKFLMMVEYEKCGHGIKAALTNTGIYYCFIDDFCTGNTEELQKSALLREVNKSLRNSVQLNINDLLRQAYQSTRIDMTAKEKRQFYDRYIKSMKLKIDEDGAMIIELG